MRVAFAAALAVMLPVLIMGSAGLLMSLGRSTTPLALMMGSIVVCVIATLFVRHEYRHPDPVIKPQLFRHRAVTAANAGIGLGNLAMYTLLLSVPPFAGESKRRHKPPNRICTA